MTRHQDQPNKKEPGKQDEEIKKANDAMDPGDHAERDGNVKDDRSKGTKNNRHSTKFSHTKRIRPLL